MSKRKQPEWVLNEDWAVSIDPYNWILYRRSGTSWRPNGYYATPEMLLKSLLQIITRTEPHQPTLELHINRCLSVAQAAADRLYSQLGTHPLPRLKARPPAVQTMLQEQEAADAS